MGSAPVTLLFIAFLPVLRIRIRDPESSAFLTLGRIRDPGSQPQYFLELGDKFLGKKLYNSLKTGPNFFLQHLKNKIIFNFVKFVATKKGLTTYFLTPLCCCCFWIRDPGSEIRDPGSEIRDPEWVKIRIRDPG
jgi:hypothetical protein